MAGCQAFSPKAGDPLQRTVFSILGYAIIAPNRSWKGSAFPMLPLWSDGSSSQRERRKEDSRSHLALPFCTTKSRQGRRDLVFSQVWQDWQARLPSWSSSSEWDSAGEGTEKVTLGNCFPCKDLCVPIYPLPWDGQTSLLFGRKFSAWYYVTVSTSPLQGVHKTSSLNRFLKFPYAAASSHFSYRRIKRNIRKTHITDWYQTIFS